MALPLLLLLLLRGGSSAIPGSCNCLRAGGRGSPLEDMGSEINGLCRLATGEGECEVARALRKASFTCWHKRPRGGVGCAALGGEMAKLDGCENLPRVRGVTSPRTGVPGGDSRTTAIASCGGECAGGVMGPPAERLVAGWVRLWGDWSKLVLLFLATRFTGRPRLGSSGASGISFLFLLADCLAGFCGFGATLEGTGSGGL